MSSSAPATLDQFEVLETLGTGSFGTVSKIKRRSDGKVLVWKAINFGSMSEREKTQLVSEVNILRELRNPFIIRYHDRIVDKAHTRLYILMEHCAGGDLGRVIKKTQREKKYLDEAFIWKILSQSMCALRDCHRRTEANGTHKPILHRDIKPANILLDNEMNVKMGDFGLAKELNSASQLAQTNVGTPYYMAPEIINERQYDEKSDIWSLGCVLYELAALRPPFDANNAVQLAVKINAGIFPRIPSKFSDSLANTIKAMLQLDPRRRPRIEELESLSVSHAPFHNALSLARNALNDFKRERDSQNALSQRVRDVQKKEIELKEREDSLARRERELAERERALQNETEKFESRVRAFHRQQREREKERETESGERESEKISLSEKDRRGPVPLPSGPTIARPVPPPPPSNVTGNAFQIHCDFPAVGGAVSSAVSGAVSAPTQPVAAKRGLSLLSEKERENKENHNVPIAPSKPFKFAPSAALQRRPLSAHNYAVNGALGSASGEMESPMKRARVGERENVQVEMDALLARRPR